MAADDVLDDRPSKRARVSDAGQESEAISNKTVDTAVVREAEIEEEEEVEDLVLDVEESKPSDLYLDTISRTTLDFDFEKLCSVCLTDIHVYGCLVCGKYFQGRGKSTYAYAHSVHEDHHVFINLETAKVYVLPDGYEVSDPSLEDIAYVLNPTFNKASIIALARTALTPSFDLASTSYIPGYIGLNNIKHNDHLNVVIHTLVHVPPLRDFLLLSDYKLFAKEPELLRRFAGLAKKIWNRRLFKAQVSPHEFLQEVNRASKGKFRLEQRGDPGEFMGWLLNRLHIDLGGTKKPNSSVIYSTFQGALKVETQKVSVKADSDGRTSRPNFDVDRETQTTHSPFLFLSVDLPPPPLFQDAVEKNIIAQITLASVLAKYDGTTTNEALGLLKRYKCTRLPPYIILHFKRFTKNNFVEEKNPTIVNFPLRGVDFREYLDIPQKSTPPYSTVYELLANVTHESTGGTTRDKANTVWKVHLRAGSGGGEEERWFQVQDLIVEPVQKEMIFLGETVVQVWERRDVESGKGKTPSNGMDVDSR